jgi:hypothetical protein
MTKVANFKIIKHRTNLKKYYLSQNMGVVLDSKTIFICKKHNLQKRKKKNAMCP